jgi:hypothetical protein
MMKSHGEFVDALQEQSGKLAETLIVPLSPAAGADTCETPTTKAHGKPGCDKVTLWPATATMAVRLAESEFADAVKLTVPFPVPLAPLVTLTQSVVENASHGQEFWAAITLALLDPPALVKVTCAGSTEYMQPIVDADGISALTLGGHWNSAPKKSPVSGK